MTKPRVYVETTVPNFYYDFRPSEAVAVRRVATRRWWATAAMRFELVTSLYVHHELSAGRSAWVPLRLRLLDGLPVLPAVREVDTLVEVYIRNKLMPADPVGDAMHLALASFYMCDLIVTWNCGHLANPSKAMHIRRINARLGLGTPRLVTPSELMHGGADEPR